MSDVDSFDIASGREGEDDHSHVLFGEQDFGPNRSTMSAGGRFINKIRYWFYRNRMSLESYSGGVDSSSWTQNRDEIRGIPLYNMDDNGESGFGDDEQYDLSSLKRQHYAVRKGFFLKIIGAVTLIVITAVLIADSVKTNVSHRVSGNALLSNLLNNHEFDPYRKYFNGTQEFYPLTIMVSIDGFHPSLISKRFTPFLHELYTVNYEGYNVTSAPYMIPSFPTQTFPNHWTLVTGEYPIHHGMIANIFYDSKLDDEFSPSNVDPLMWINASEPIWQTVQNAYTKDHSHDEMPFKVATHMWPGSYVNYTKIKGVPHERMPYYCDPFDSKETLEEKLNSIVEYMDIKTLNDRPQMILSYIPNVDEFGHKYGYPLNQLNSKIGKKFIELLEDVDKFFYQLFFEIEQRNLNEFTNVIIVSDHGMSDISLPENAIAWEDLVDTKISKSHIAETYFEGPMIAIVMNEVEDTNIVYHELKQNLNKQILSPFFKIYLNGQFPEEWNFNIGDGDLLSKRRMPMMWVVPEPGFAIVSKSNLKKSQKQKNGSVIGSHGYNNTNIDMRSLFIGVGPFFNNGYIEPFENVEIYDLLCDITGVSHKDRNVRQGRDRHFEGEDLFLAEEFFDLEDDFEYLVKRFGNYSTYNEIWGGYSWEETLETTPSAEASASTTSTVSSTSFTSPMASTTSSPAPSSSSSAPVSSNHKWYNEIVQDAKDLFDDTKDLVADLAADLAADIDHILDSPT